MLTKTTYALIAALVLAAASTASAQSHRQNGVSQYSNPNWEIEQSRLDPAKGEDQCRQAASGNNGYCYRNPFYDYAGYPADQPDAAEKYRR